MKLKPLVVPGKLESLNAIAKFVIATAQLARLDSKTIYKLRLAVDEIATKIIQVIFLKKLVNINKILGLYSNIISKIK